MHTIKQLMIKRAWISEIARWIDTSEGSEEEKGRKKCCNCIHHKGKALLLLLSRTFRLSFPTHHVVRWLHPFFLDSISLVRPGFGKMDISLLYGQDINLVCTIGSTQGLLKCRQAWAQVQQLSCNLLGAGLSHWLSRRSQRDLPLFRFKLQSLHKPRLLSSHMLHFPLLQFTREVSTKHVSLACREVANWSAATNIIASPKEPCPSPKVTNWIQEHEPPRTPEPV